MTEKTTPTIQKETLSQPSVPLSYNTNVATTVTQESFDRLNEAVLNLDKDLKEAKNNFEKSRFDLVTLLGVFVGLITYLGLEIQVFKTIDNPLLIIGVSIFFIASILLFVLTINLILKKLESIGWEDFSNPLYRVLIILLVISIIFIICGYIDYSIHKNVHAGVSITYGD